MFKNTCSFCNGSGLKPVTDADGRCKTCSGIGTYPMTDADLGVRRECLACEGTGRQGGKKPRGPKHIQAAVDQLNAVLGLTSGMLGFYRYGDMATGIKPKRRVFTLAQQGQERESIFNGKNNRETVDKLLTEVQRMKDLQEKRNGKP